MLLPQFPRLQHLIHQKCTIKAQKWTPTPYWELDSDLTGPEWLKHLDIAGGDEPFAFNLCLEVTCFRQLELAINRPVLYLW